MNNQSWGARYTSPTERELLEAKRRRCVRDMDDLQKEIDEIDRQIEAIELREQQIRQEAA
jgi:transposase